MDSGMYTEREMQCVKEGIGAVRSVLSGTDTEAKRRLLFYLDWYMDPYYKQDISGIKNDLKEMLEKVAVSPNEEDIIDEALHLLEGYTDPPYPILVAYLGNLSGKHKPKALYLLQGAGWRAFGKTGKRAEIRHGKHEAVFLLYHVSKGGHSLLKSGYYCGEKNGFERFDQGACLADALLWRLQQEQESIF